MRKPHNRLPAFTIMEVTIALLISAIVIAITYTAYTMISGAYLRFTEKNNQMATLIRLDELLRKDFDRAERITRLPDSLMFREKDATVRYEFLPQAVIRTSAASDTFRVEALQYRMLYEQHLIGEENDSAEQPWVDELRLSLFYKNEKFPYHYIKVYSAENLFQ